MRGSQLRFLVRNEDEHSKRVKGFGDNGRRQPSETGHASCKNEVSRTVEIHVLVT
jgi:hypothetical protein